MSSQVSHPIKVYMTRNLSLKRLSFDRPGERSPE